MDLLDLAVSSRLCAVVWVPLVDRRGQNPITSIKTKGAEMQIAQNPKSDFFQQTAITAKR